MDADNPFERAQLIQRAMRNSEALYQDKMRALSLGVEGLKREYATDRLSLEDLERLLPLAIEHEANHSPRPVHTDAPGAIFDYSYPTIGFASRGIRPARSRTVRGIYGGSRP